MERDPAFHAPSQVVYFPSLTVPGLRGDVLMRLQILAIGLLQSLLLRRWWAVESGIF